MRGAMKTSICFFVMVLWAFSGFARAGTDSHLQLPAGILAQLDSVQTDKLLKALEDAGDNSAELIGGLEQLQGPLLGDAVFLILNMPHLDRLEMTGAILVHHVIYADSARRMFTWQVPDSLYREFILTHRLGDEPITDWRFSFWDRVKGRAFKAEGESLPLGSDRAFAKQVNEWAAKSLSTVEKEFFGPQQTPDQTLATRRGTKAEIAALITALLKTAGIPSRQVTVSVFLSRPGGGQWAEIFCASCGKWLPLYPDSPEWFGEFSFWEPESIRHNVSYAYALSAFDMVDVTPHYSQTGWLQLKFSRDGEPASSFDGFSVNVFNQGSFQPLDELGTAADSLGIYTCRLGEGGYWVIAGVRDAVGSPYVQLLPADVQPGDTTRLGCDLAPPAREAVDSLQLRYGPMPLMVFNDAAGNVRSSREAVRQSSLLIVLLYPRHEPSVRMEGLVDAWLKRQKKNAPKILWVWRGDKTGGLRSNMTFDPKGYLADHFDLSSHDDYPLVIWVGEDGYVRRISKGYNLKIEAMLDEALSSD